MDVPAKRRQKKENNKEQQLACGMNFTQSSEAGWLQYGLCVLCLGSLAATG
jgi:hypothetical protein